jgi:hypothetical protein
MDTPNLASSQKDLIGIPWRVAFALQADGWYLRQDIIWHKPNPMPESVRDRCTKAHEYVFLLSKVGAVLLRQRGDQEPAQRYWCTRQMFANESARTDYGRTMRSKDRMASRLAESAKLATAAACGPCRRNPSREHTSPRSRPILSARAYWQGARRMARCWTRSAGQALRPWWLWRKAERLCCAS